MTEHFENLIFRPIRVVTQRVTMDGLMTLYPGWRTQDELNAAARPMLTLASPLVTTGELAPGDGAVAVNKASVLFAMEIPDLGAPPDPPAGFDSSPRFDYSLLRLSLAQYEIEGYVCTTRGVEALARLNQISHPFIALTMATIRGTGIDFSLSFVAVNRFHVVVAREILGLSMIQDESASGGAPL